eukprot:1316342-Amphidinium_carterae.2
MSSPFITDDVFRKVTSIQSHPCPDDLESWGDWKVGSSAVDPAPSPGRTKEPAAAQASSAAVELNHHELEAVYGRGYHILVKHGFVGQAKPPLVGVQRRSKIGVQDDESEALTYRAHKALASKPSVILEGPAPVLNPSEVLVEGGMERGTEASDNVELLICWQLFVRQAFKLMVSISSLKAGVASYLLRPHLDIPQLLTVTGSKLTHGVCASRTAANYIRGQLLDIRVLAEIFQVAVSVLSPAGLVILSYPEDDTLLLYGECVLQMSFMGTEFSLISWTRWHYMEWFESPYSAEQEVAATKRVAACVAELETPLRSPVSSTAPFSSPAATSSSRPLSIHDGKWGDPNARWTTNSATTTSADAEDVVEGGMHQASSRQAGTTLDVLWPHFLSVAFDLHLTLEQLHSHRLGYVRMLQRDAQSHYGYLFDVARLASFPFSSQRDEVVGRLVDLLCYAEMEKTMITVVSATGRAVLVYPETDELRSSCLAACTLRISEDGTHFLLLSWVRWTSVVPSSTVLTTLPEQQESHHQQRADIYTIWSTFLRRTFGVAMSAQLIRFVVAEFASCPANDVAALLLRAAAQLNRNDWSRFDAYYVRSQLFDAMVLSSVFEVAVTVENINGHIILSYPDSSDRLSLCGVCRIQLSGLGSQFELLRSEYLQALQRTFEEPDDHTFAAVCSSASRRLIQVAAEIESPTSILTGSNVEWPASGPVSYGPDISTDEFSSLGSSMSTRVPWAPRTPAVVEGGSTVQSIKCFPAYAQQPIADAALSVGTPLLVIVIGGALMAHDTTDHSSDPPSEAGFECDSEEALEEEESVLIWPGWKIPLEEPPTEQFMLLVSIGAQKLLEVHVPDSWTRDTCEDYFAKHLAVHPAWLCFSWVGNKLDIQISPLFPCIGSDSFRGLVAACDELPSGPSTRRLGIQGVETVVGHRATRLRGITNFTVNHHDECMRLVSGAASFLPNIVFNALALVKHGSVPVHRDVTNDPRQLLVLTPVHVELGSSVWIESDSGVDSVAFHGDLLYGSWFPYTRVLACMAASAHRLSVTGKCVSLVLYRTARMPSTPHLFELSRLGFALSSAELDIMANPVSEAVVADEPDAAGVVEQPTAVSVGPFRGFDDELEEQVFSQAELRADDEAVSILILKATQTNYLRKYQLRLAVGADVLQARTLLKKHLKLNIVRVVLTSWNGDGPGADLPDDQLLTAEEGPFFVRVRSLAEVSEIVDDDGKASVVKAARKSSPPVKGPAELPPSAPSKLPIGAARSSAASDKRPRSPPNSGPPPPAALRFRLADDHVHQCLRRIELNQRLIADALGVTLVNEAGASSSGTHNVVQGGAFNPKNSQNINTAADEPHALEAAADQSGAGSQSCVSRQSEEATFVPPSGTQVHSCFACCLFIAQLPYDMDSIFSLRQSVGRLLRQAYSDSRLIAGLPLVDWARGDGLSVRDFVHRVDCPPFRPASLCDAYLISLTLGTSVWILGSCHSRSMKSHSTPPFGLVRVDDIGHFVTYLPDSEVLAECFADRVTELSLCVMGEPRTSSLLRLLAPVPSPNWLADSVDIQFYHSHCVSGSAHLRLVLAVPSPPRVIDASDAPPEMVLILCGMRNTRQLPPWTSFVRVAAELDLDTANPDVILEVYHFMDQMVTNRLENLMEMLLEANSPELAAASQLCHHLMERAAISKYVTFRRFVHKFRFLVFVPGTECVNRMDFGTFHECCRRNHTELHYGIFDDLTVDPPPVPCIVLASEQVMIVRNSILSAYGVRLSNYDAAREDFADTVVDGGARTKKVKLEVFQKMARQFAAPALSGHINEKLLMYLLSHDQKLASSLHRSANTHQVIVAVSSALKKCGLDDIASSIEQLPRPGSLDQDPVAALRASLGRGEHQATSPSAPVRVESSDSHAQLLAEHQELRSNLQSVTSELKALSTWAEQFEADASTLPGFVARDYSDIVLRQELALVKEGVHAAKAEVKGLVDDASLQMRRLQVNQNRLEGLIIAQQERVSAALEKVTTEAAKQSDVLDQCRAVLAAVLQARDKWKTDVSLLASHSGTSTLPMSSGSYCSYSRGSNDSEIHGLKQRLAGEHALHYGNLSLIQQVGAFARFSHSQVQADSRSIATLKQRVDALTSRLDATLEPASLEEPGVQTALSHLPVLSLAESLPDCEDKDSKDAEGGDGAQSGSSSDVVEVSAS